MKQNKEIKQQKLRLLLQPRLKATNLRMVLATAIPTFIITGLFIVLNFSALQKTLSKSVTDGSIPMPVCITDFTAVAISNTNVLLVWTTGNEENIDHFTIERSADGKEFSELTQIAPQDTSNGGTHYSFTDLNPPRGTPSYRLTQTDVDGNTEIFKVVPVTIDATSGKSNLLQLTPTSFVNWFAARFESPRKQRVQITIMPLDGSTFYTEKFTATEGPNTYHFAAPPSFKGGNYVVSLPDGETILATGKINNGKN